MSRRLPVSVFPTRGPALDFAKIYLQVLVRLRKLVERADRLNNARLVLLRLREKIQKAEANLG
jgi:hypothetical protein